MKCRYCNTDNPGGTHYCRYCGKKTRMMPTSIFDWKQPVIMKFFYRLFLIATICTALLTAYVGVAFYSYTTDYSEDSPRIECEDGLFGIISEWDYRSYDYHDGNYIYHNPVYVDAGRCIAEYQEQCLTSFFVMLVLSVVAFILMWRCKRKLKPAGAEKLSDIADYVERYSNSGFASHNYVVYEREGLWGLLDTARYEVQLDAKYEELQWVDRDKTLRVKEAGADSYVVTVDGERLR